MADETQPVVQIDPDMDVEENLLALINATNNTSFEMGDISISDMVDDPDQGLAGAKVTINGVVAAGYRGSVNLHYRRVDLALLQNLLGPFHVAYNATVEEIVPRIEQKIGLVPGHIEMVPGEIKAGNTLEFTALSTSRLYYGRMQITLRPAIPEISLGSNLVMAGNQEVGYMGEYRASDIVAPLELIDSLNMRSQFSGDVEDPTVVNPDTHWLKFVYKSNILFVAKNIMATGITWDSLNDLGLVTGGATIALGGHTFKVRLLNGSSIGYFNGTGGLADNVNELRVTNEWIDLIYPVCAAVSNSPYNTRGEFAHFSEEEMNLNGGSDKFPSMGYNQTWCQEYQYGNSNYRLTRGGNDAYGAAAYDDEYRLTSAYGWRPVLELVS